jgi:hypothetical protein
MLFVRSSNHAIKTRTAALAATNAAKNAGKALS